MKRMVATNGIRLAVTDEGSGFPVVLCHGFPELGYSWRHQAPALAGAGLRPIAPDLRGYGDSDKPDELEAYGLLTLVADLVGLLDGLDVEQAALVGHDWGAIITWTTAVLHPERVARLVSLAVPYRGWCAAFPPTDYLREKLSDRFGYVLRFQEPGKTEQWFASDPGGILAGFYQAVTANPDFLSDGEFAVFRDAFIAGGISGPVNYYRNIDANHAATAHLANSIIEVPTLMITPDSDPVLPASLADGMDRWVPNLQTEMVADCGHWVQQEQPERVNELLIDFLGDLAG